MTYFQDAFAICDQMGGRLFEARDPLHTEEVLKDAASLGIVTLLSGVADRYWGEP